MAITAFSEGHGPSVLSDHLEEVIKEIRGLQNSHVLATSPTELEQFYLGKTLIEPLILHIDQCHIERQKSVQIDVSRDQDRSVRDRSRPCYIPGTDVELAIPFEGDEQLWKVKPSSYSISGYPEIEIRPDSILLRFRFPDDTPDHERLKREIDRQLRQLGQAVDTIYKDVEQHNAKAPAAIREALERKRTQALAASNLVSALGIPMRLREEPATYIAPIQRRKPPVSAPRPATGPYTPEPELAAPEYEHILKVIRSLSLVVERNPMSFATLDEESIRDHILLQLNGHYEGAATGETFNSSGKTDILIRVNDRNVFIAECKFWHGPKKFAEAVDQLLSYLTWRDCKCALIVFNRQKSSSNVVQKMHETIAAHKGHRKTTAHDPTGDSRYVFVKDSDPGREIVITTQVFDLPS